MFRSIALAAALASLPIAASAVEMQTNFHYGERVGFPPMEVPTTVYGGWGTPGWNCNAMGKVPVQSGLPAMYPTGCNPNASNYGGCNYCNSVWAGYQQKAFHKRINTRWYYGNHRALPAGGPGPADGIGDEYTDGQTVSVENGNSVIVPPQGLAPSPMAPTPATPEQIKPADGKPTPRTTSRPLKSKMQRASAG